jgi:glycosyltransferase involved in cell wall biosynthesis
MRILICNWRDLAHPAAGGAEVYTEEMARRWVAAGHQVTLFAAAVAGRRSEEVVHGVRVVRRGSRFGVYRAARDWYTAEGRGRFDLVIDEVNTRPFDCPRWVDDAPVVALVHQTCEEIWHHQLPWPVAVLGRRVLEPRWLARYAEVPALAVSSSTRDALARFGVTRVTVVPEGLALPADVGTKPKETDPTVVHVGRLVAYKQPHQIVEAVAAAREQIPGLQLWFIGGGPLEEDLRRRHHPGVTLFGHVSQAEKFDRMARAHALLVASIREGWGLVVAEAAAVGTRTIGYDAPGVRDAVAAAGGILTPPDPQAMAAWIAEVLPAWIAEPPAPVPQGGVRDWDDVATAVLAAALDHASPPVRELRSVA